MFYDDVAQRILREKYLVGPDAAMGVHEDPDPDEVYAHRFLIVNRGEFDEDQCFEVRTVSFNGLKSALMYFIHNYEPHEWQLWDLDCEQEMEVVITGLAVRHSAGEFDLFHSRGIY